MTSATQARIAASIERSLTLEEARTYLDTPIGPAERADVLDLVPWFRRRYPTPLERLAYVTRAYKRWAPSRR